MQKKRVNKEDYHRPRIGIDLLGCETPSHQILKAILSHDWEKEEYPPVFNLFGNQELFSQFPKLPEDLHIRIATEIITMDDDPLLSVRRKKNSSLSLGIQELKSYDIDALITAGNSGALLAGATLSLPLMTGIDRPAFLALIPTKKEAVAVLDVGANTSVRADNLLQFAKMGIAYQKARGVQNPTVGLLNIGEEKRKGTPELRKAYELLQILNQDSPIDNPTFVGNIEGRNVFHGTIDVLVTDGFTGNVFLKTSQGIAGFVLDQIEHLGPIEMVPKIHSILTTLRHRLSYAEYPGAILCGVDGVIMKCHGESPPQSFVHSIISASRLIKHSFIDHLKAELSR